MTYDCLPCPGVGILNLAWDGKFEPELSSLSSGTKVSYFFIQRCFEVQISLSRADGSEKEISKKVPVTNLAFYKKFD